MSTGRKIADAELPSGWQVVRLGEFADVRSGIGFPLDRQGREIGTYPFIKVSDMNLAGNEKFIRFANNYVEHADAAELGGTPLPENTVICPKVGAAIATNKKRILTVPTLIDNNMVGISLANQATCDPRYLFYWFETVDLSDFANVSAVPSITGSRLKRATITLPPLPEQRAIADVLDSIDEAIERTEAVIAATETLRDSLLHELLTRGVPGWHTEWKDVPGIGTIPADWKVVRLGEVIADGPTNGIYKPESDYGSGTPIIRIDDFIPGELVNLECLRRVRLEPGEMQRYAIREGEILINRVNSMSHIGKTVLVPAIGEIALFESNMMKLKLNDDVHPKFGELVLLSDLARRHFVARAKKAVQQASINQQDVAALPFPLPSMQEQQMIVDTVQSVDRRIDAGRIISVSLVRAKSTIADALLTGRIRLEAY